MMYIGSPHLMALGGSDILHVSCDLENVITIQEHKQYNYAMYMHALIYA